MLFGKLMTPIIRASYLLKIQQNHGFQVRFEQISRNGKTIIHLLDKTKCPINSTHDLEILSPNQIRQAK